MASWNAAELSVESSACANPSVNSSLSSVKVELLGCDSV
jgi:hypothetical protein